LKFKGLVIKVKKANHPDGTFTIRGDAARMTVEKIYPLSFPNFDKVLLMDDYKIRRSKLYYIRTKVGKDARFKSIIEHGKKGTDLLDLIRQDSVAEVKEEAVVEKVEETKIEEVKTEEKKEETKE
jgi:large subunit ribosomal protein L19